MKLTPLLPFFIALLAVAVPFSQATVTHTDTYPVANTDQAAFTDAIAVGGNLYFLMNSAIYDFNLTNYNLTKVFDAGFNYILSSILYLDGNFYLSGYKLYHPPSTGGSGRNIPVVTCPLPIQNYDVNNFTVWKLSTEFAVQSSVILQNFSLQNISYHYVISAMKLYDVAGQIYAIIFDTNLQASTHSTYIYTVDFSTGKLNNVATLNKEYIQAVHGKDWVFLSDNNAVDIYDSNFNLLKTYQDSQYNLAMKNIYADSQYIYLAGRGYDGSTWGAALEIIDYNASMVFYHQFNNAYQFFDVYAYEKYAYVSTNGTLYQVDWYNNTVTDEYTANLQHVYDMKTESYKDISNEGPEAWTIIAYSHNGNLSFAWGGYFTDGSEMYAYMVLTQKPLNIVWQEPSSGGAWIPFTDSSTWTHYKYYIIGFGVLFLLAVIFAGGRRRNKEVRR